jgi:hypothetical protein
MRRVARIRSVQWIPSNSEHWVVESVCVAQRRSFISHERRESTCCHARASAEWVTGQAGRQQVPVGAVRLLWVVPAPDRTWTKFEVREPAQRIQSHLGFSEIDRFPVSDEWQDWNPAQSFEFFRLKFWIKKIIEKLEIVRRVVIYFFIKKFMFWYHK